MDLGTIKKNIVDRKYKTLQEAHEDVKLVWSNCMTYNADGSDFWLLAKSYSRRFEDRYRKVRQECKKVDDVSFLSPRHILEKRLGFSFLFVFVSCVIALLDLISFFF